MKNQVTERLASHLSDGLQLALQIAGDTGTDGRTALVHGCPGLKGKKTPATGGAAGAGIKVPRKRDGEEETHLGGGGLALLMGVRLVNLIHGQPIKMADPPGEFDAWLLLTLFYPAQVACICLKQRSSIPQNQPAFCSGLFDDVHGASIALTAILCQVQIARTAYQARLLLGHAANVNTNQKLGRAIDQLRTRKGVNKKEMALATGIDAGNLNRIISGTQWPSPERLDTLAAYFDLKPSDLFRIGEQGFIEAPRKEDARRTALKSMIDKLEENQLDAVFRQQVDDDCEPAKTGPAIGKTPTTSRAA